MDQQIPPFDVAQVLGGETSEFMVKAENVMPIRKLLGTLFFGIFWLGFSSIFVFALWGPLLAGKDLHMKVNGEPVTVSAGHLGPIVLPSIIIGLFLLIGIGIIGWCVATWLADGPWFIGTPKRLIVINPRRIHSIDWEQFNGDIELNGTSGQGDVCLKLRTGRMVSRRYGGSMGSYGGTQMYTNQYVADEINMVGISNALSVEEVCRRHIKENDPTPAAGPA